MTRTFQSEKEAGDMKEKGKKCREENREKDTAESFEEMEKKAVKEKAARNRTIDFTLEEGKEYAERCISVDTKQKDTKKILDRLIVGDCMKVMDFLPGQFADLMIVDPPYNLAKDYHGNKFNPKSWEEYREYTRSWLRKALPLLKPTASVYVCCDWKSSLVIGEVLHEFFRVRNRITWQREKGRGAKTNWKNGMEDVWFATVGNEYTFHLEDVMIRRKVNAPYKIEGKPKDWEETEEGNFRNTCPSNFWDDISIPYWSMPENTAHPTQKPEKLMAKLILASSSVGDVVFDPFGGAGTTAVTAKKLGRHFVTIEQNQRYFAWAGKRLEMAQEDPVIQGYRDGVFWERNSWAEQSRRKKKP